MTRRNRRGRGYYTPQELPIAAILGRREQRDDDEPADAVEQPDNAADLQRSTSRHIESHFLDTL